MPGAKDLNAIRSHVGRAVVMNNRVFNAKQILLYKYIGVHVCHSQRANLSRTRQLKNILTARIATPIENRICMRATLFETQSHCSRAQQSEEPHALLFGKMF